MKIQKKPHRSLFDKTGQDRQKLQGLALCPDSPVWTFIMVETMGGGIARGGASLRNVGRHTDVTQFIELNTIML